MAQGGCRGAGAGGLEGSVEEAGLRNVPGVFMLGCLRRGVCRERLSGGI